MTNEYNLFRYLCIGFWTHVRCLCFCALLVSPVFADSVVSDYQLIEFQSGQGFSPGRAADIVQASIVGKVLSVSSGTHKGIPVYRVKVLLADGRVKVIRISLESGQLLN